MSASLSAANAPRRRLRILRRPSESIRPATPRPQRRDCHGRLSAALLDLAGAQAIMADAHFRPWCSATFIGAQHGFVLKIAGPDAARRAQALAARLPDAEIRVAGHVVADLALDAVRREEDGTWSIEMAVLTIEDW